MIRRSAAPTITTALSVSRGLAWMEPALERHNAAYRKRRVTGQAFMHAT